MFHISKSGTVFLLVFSSLVLAQDPSTTAPVTTERPTIRFTEQLDSPTGRQLILLDEETDVVLAASRELKVGSPGARDRWILDRVGQMSGIESATIVENIVAETSGAGTKARRRSNLDVTGNAGAVADAAKFVTDVLTENSRRRFSVELRLTVEKVAVDDVKTWDARKPRVTALDAAAFDVEKTRHHSNANVFQIAAPELIVLGAQRATIAIKNQTAYIKDWSLMVGPGSMIMDPLIDVVQDGVDADLTVMALPGKNSTLVSGKVTVRVLKRPVDKLEGKVSGTQTAVTLELPLVASVDWELDQLVLEEGEVGFLAEGMIYPEMPTATKRDPTLSRNVRDEAQSTKLLRILLRVTPTDETEAKVARLAGQVLGFDPHTMQAFFVPEKSVSPLAGQRLSIRRGESFVGQVLDIQRPKAIIGRAVVVEDKGGIVVCAVTEGEVARGDEIWFEFDEK